MTPRHIPFIKGEPITYQFQSLETDLSAYQIEMVLKKRVTDDTPCEGWTAYLSGDVDGNIVLAVPSTSGIDWTQTVYDIKLTDGSGKITYPFAGVVWRLK